MSCEENDELAPTQLLSMAIKKRRSLYESKDRDFRKELLHTGMIQTLCKFLGEGRALKKKRGSKRKHRSQNSQNPNKMDLPKKYAISNADLEGMDVADQPPKDGQGQNHEPTMLELNGQDDGDVAVVPVMKRPKYEQVFDHPTPETEPTEQEKEIIKEYVFDDFFSSLASFYTPNDYYSSVEPTKDLYWCCDDDTEPPFIVPNDPFVELLAFCS